VVEEVVGFGGFLVGACVAVARLLAVWFYCRRLAYWQHRAFLADRPRL